MQTRMFYLLIMILAGFNTGLKAQDDCVLGVGITADSTLVDIFQLNEEQTEKLKNWSAELKYRNELLNGQAENLLKRHPQSSAAELKVLAEKYKVIHDSMAIVQRMVDIRTLKLFNENQYRLYLSLCKEAFRQPYLVTPTNYRDSIPPK